MVYKIFARLIELGSTDDLDTRIDVLYAAGKLTDDEYAELTTALSAMTEEAT